MTKDVDKLIEKVILSGSASLALTEQEGENEWTEDQKQNEWNLLINKYTPSKWSYYLKNPAGIVNAFYKDRASFKTMLSKKSKGASQESMILKNRLASALSEEALSEEEYEDLPEDKQNIIDEHQSKLHKDSKVSYEVDKLVQGVTYSSWNERMFNKVVANIVEKVHQYLISQDKEWVFDQLEENGGYISDWASAKAAAYLATGIDNLLHDMETGGDPEWPILDQSAIIKAF